MWANSVWNLAILGLTLILAAIGLPIGYQWLQPWCLGGSALSFFLFLVVLVWPIFRQAYLRGVPGNRMAAYIICACLGVSFAACILYIALTQDSENIVKPTTRYGLLSNADFKLSLIDFSKNLSDFQVYCDEASRRENDDFMHGPRRDTWPIEAKQEAFELRSRQIVKGSTERNNKFVEDFLPKLNNYIEELKIRLGNKLPEPPRALSVLQSGLMAGVRPAALVAGYLKDCASIIPN